MSLKSSPQRCQTILPSAPAKHVQPCAGLICSRNPVKTILWGSISGLRDQKVSEQSADVVRKACSSSSPGPCWILGLIPPCVRETPSSEQGSVHLQAGFRELCRRSTRRNYTIPNLCDHFVPEPFCQLSVLGGCLRGFSMCSLLSIQEKYKRDQEKLQEEWVKAQKDITKSPNLQEVTTYFSPEGHIWPDRFFKKNMFILFIFYLI